MAEELLALREQMVAEATCPLCLDLFEQPVLTECGHSFCGQCLAGALGNPPRRAPCPQCRAPVEPGSLRPNRSLGNMAGLARSLEEVAARPRCPQHGKPLALFCEPCAALLCAHCRAGPEHGRHRVRPAEEAARELRETLQSNLLSLQEEKEKWKHIGDEKSEDLMMMVESELERVPETFEELQQCLEEQKNVLVAQLEQMSQELVNKSRKYMSRVAERESLLDTVIAQIQEKRDQPALEFLKDVGTILSSCEAAKAPIPEPVSPELQRSIETLTWKSQWVVDMLDKFRVSLQRERDWEREQVTLDPETANEYLILSKDCKTVRIHPMYFFKYFRRFPRFSFVFGSQGFSSGRHFWDVEVRNGGFWALGLAIKSEFREEECRSEKVWALENDLSGTYTAKPRTSFPLGLREKLQRIRVCLDYEAGQVTFYNLKDMTQILQLEATFTEKVFPYFWVGSPDTHIRVCD